MARSKGRIFQRGNWMWIAYSYNGVEHREPAKDKEGAGTSDRVIAEKVLQKRLDEITTEFGGGPAFATPASRRLTVRDLLETLKAQFKQNGQDSPQTLSHLKRADEDFGQYRAMGLRPKKIMDYRQKRLDAGHAPASINRTLQLVRQAFLLAVNNEEIPRAPHIELLSEKGNGRKGFCEEPEFRKIYSFLPEHLADLALFGYCTGMRLGEILSLKWANVRGDVIELEAQDAKGDRSEGNARLIPMVGKDLAGILERRKAARQVKTSETTTLAALIFHHNGRPIVDIRKAWKTACKKAGVPNRLFHDLRRSFCKNADEAGVSRDVAMSLSGHRSQDTYRRYNIADVKRKRKALELVQEFRDREAAQAQAEQTNVVPIAADK